MMTPYAKNKAIDDILESVRKNKLELDTMIQDLISKSNQVVDDNYDFANCINTHRRSFHLYVRTIYSPTQRHSGQPACPLPTHLHFQTRFSTSSSNQILPQNNKTRVLTQRFKKSCSIRANSPKCYP